MKKIITLTLLALYCGTSLLAAKQDITPTRKLVYKTIDSQDLQMHIFEPEGHQSSDKQPVAVFFYGGGWAAGTPVQMYQQCQYLAKLGIVAISADYRVQMPPNTNPFHCVTDAKSAVRYIRSHATELGINPDRIITGGASAGGHIAICTALIDGFEQEGEDLSISSVPNAIIAFNPVLDTTENGYGVDRVGQDRKFELSLTHHVHPIEAPTLFFHGTADTTVPFENAQRFQRLMTEAGNDCQLVPFEGKNHGFFNGSHFRPRNGDTDFDKTMVSATRFLQKLGYIDAPITRGYIADEGYSVGKVLYKSSFNKPKHWEIQIEEGDTDKKPKVEFKKDTLDLYMPAAGCTAWLKKKFNGPIMISYRVKCPTETVSPPDIQIRDINNFWNASEPVKGESLFDSQRYTGGFVTYHKMHGYYASTGGGGPNQSNYTTRFRRYPRRNPEEQDIEHIALNDRDGDSYYTITPDTWHQVQLVAANGIAQYIVDGKLVYQIKEGTPINIEKWGQDPYETTYTRDQFPAYTSGYFGLRLVRTHHIYKDLKIYQLEQGK